MIAAAAQAGGTDKKFVVDAIKGDNSEMALADMAAQRGVSQGVRDFGVRLSADHKKARADAAATARKIGANVSKDMTPEAQEESQRLARLSGAEFDREFARYMVDDHQKDIQEFEAHQDGKGAVAAMARRARCRLCATI